MSAKRKAQVRAQQESDGMTAVVYGILSGWPSEMAATRWSEGSEGIEFLAQLKDISGILGFKIETLTLRCHHNLARE